MVSNPVSKDHPRYSSVKRFKYYQILRKYNDWVITVIIKKGTDEEEYESVHKVVLDALVNNTSQAIQVGSIGAIDADNRHSHGCYMVGFTYDTYTLKKTIDGQFMESG